MSVVVFDIQEAVVEALQRAYPRCEISKDPNSGADFIVEADKTYEKLEVKIHTSLFESLDFGVKKSIREEHPDVQFRSLSSNPELIIIK